MIGTIIGSYKITEKIGEGGMGAVFKGIDTMLEREVAIKMLKPDLASQPDIVERFRSEAVTLAKLNHANIATLYSFVRQGEDFFMVMEFVRGQTLDEVIRKFGAIDCNRAIALFCQALEGIDHAHRMGIVHRDIKPANIMLTDTGSIKVMDFGIARVLGTARMTRQGNIVGTVEYMAPEQVRGQAADARSDIYSLGILLYEMLTGRVPFESDSEFELMRAQIEDAPKPPRVLFPQIPLAVEQAIMRALAKKPEARPQTAGDLRKALLGTLNASTSIVGATVPYAAPTTRVLEPPAKLTTGERAGKETVSSEEFPGETRILGGPAPATKASREMVGETKEGKASGASIAGQASKSAAGSARGSTSLMARLNWKHYAAAALVVIAMIAAASFALRMSRQAQQPTEESANQESGTAPEAPAAAPAAAETVTPPQSPAAAGNVPASDATRAGVSVSDSNANIDKVGRARGNRNEQPSETQSATGSPATLPTAPATSQPPTVAPVEAPKKEPDGSAVATQNLNKNQKKDEKKGGLGGFFKKVFGGGDKKNDNKNQKK